MHLKGGLGNQLFILAAGILLARKNALSKVILDTSFLKRDSLRDFALDQYEIPKNIRVARTSSHGIAHHSKMNFLFHREAPIVEEILDMDMELHRAACIEGYFQNYNYVDAVKDSMLRILRSSNSETLSDVLPEIYVAAHLRRGDYLNPQTLATHGLVSAEYISKGYSYLKAKLGEVPLVIFTDSPELVQSELSVIENDTFIFGPDKVSAQQVIEYMSKARGLIISNSSLSWWGAWVATRQAEDSPAYVVRPLNWFADKDTPDGLLPPEWHAIEN